MRVSRGVVRIVLVAVLVTALSPLAVSAAVPVGTFAIQAGAASTTAAAVSLDSAVTGATEMRFDVGGGFGDWVPYASTIASTLVGGDGLRTVQAEYRDAVGDVLSLSDNIALDTSSRWVAQTSGVGTNLRCVYFSDSLHGWAGGSSGVMRATTDGGATWVAQTSNAGGTTTLLSVYFVDSTRGWAVGSSGKIVATTDGGTTWVPQVSGVSSILYSVSFTDATHGWAVGASGVILVTSDGGTTWSPQTSGTASALYSVSFTDATHGWAVGAGGTVVVTTDGGANWAPQTSGTAQSLWGVHFIDAGHGWAVGAGGVIVATTDGGATWTTRSSGTGNLLYSVHFTDATHGWAVGNLGTIVVTSDGGAGWTAQTSGTGGVLYAVHFTDAAHGWAVGATGVIRSYVPPNDYYPPQTTADGVPGGWVSSDVAVTLTATDPVGSGVANTYYALNGGIGNLYSLPVTISAEGTTTFGYWSVDASGNLETSHTALVRIDKAGPSGLTLSSPSHEVSTPTNVTTVTVSFSGATDALSGVAGYSVLLSSSDSADPDETADQSLATTTTAPLADGSWYLAVRAVDSAGNAGGVVRFGPVVIDTSVSDAIPPQTTASGVPGGWVSADVAISLTATDPEGSGVANTYYALNGGIGNLYSLPVTISVEGTTTFGYWSVDVAGNSETSQAATVLIDRTGPSGLTLSSTTHAVSTPTSATTVAVSFTGAADALSGVAGYSVLLSTSDSADPDTTIDQSLPATTTDQLFEDSWYIAVRAVDSVGNAGGVVRFGPVVIDTTGPSGSVSAASGSAWTSSALVPVALASADAVEMRIDGGSGFGAWSAFATDATVTVPSGDGVKTVTAQYRDAAGNTASVTDTITLDTTAPSGSVSVVSGSAWTSSTIVPVSLTSPDATEMRLDGGSGFGAWSAFATDATVTVPSGDGVKTVTAQYRDAAGNTASVTDTITLDTTAPSGAFSVQAGAVLATTAAVSLDSAVTGATQMRFDAGAGYSAWVAYADATSTVLPAGDGVRSVTAQYRDAAGNTASVTDTITLDTTGPVGSISAAAGSAWTASTLVPVTLTSADAIEMRLDGGSGFGLWIAFASDATVTVPSGDGVKTVTAQLRDAAGNTASVTDTITLDTTAPSGAFSVQAGAVLATTAAVSLDSAVTGATQMRFDAGAGYSAWVAYADATSTVLPAGDGVRSVTAQYRDAAGNTASVTDTITLDTTAPGGTFSVQAGAVLATTAAVSLDSAVTGATQMRFDAGAGYSAWVAYADATSTVLPAGDGVRSVTAQYRDAAGNTASVTDTITLDVEAPSPPNRVSWTSVTTDAVTLSWGGASDAAGISGYRLCDGTGSAISTSAAATVRVGGLTAGGTYDYSVRTVDLAGRVSQPSAVLRVTLPHDVVRTAVLAGTSVEASGSLRVGELDGTFGVEFSQVTTAGVVEVSVLTDPPNTEGVVGFRVIGSYFDVRFSGAFDGYIDVTLPYDPSISDERAGDLQIQHWSADRWVDCTVSRDLVAHTVTGRVQSLSPFVVVEQLAPDTTPPAAVESMTAVARRGEIDLRWSVVDTSTAAVRVLRSTLGYATSPTVTVTQARTYEGTSTAVSDINVASHTTYRYTAFARDAAGNWSVAATAAATAVDAGPRDAVTLTFSGPASVVDVGRRFTLAGGMTDASGVPVTARDVTLETRVGTAWVGIAKLSPLGSAYRHTLTATSTASFRLSFDGDDSFETAVSPTVRVVIRPRAALSVPSAPSVVRRGTAFTVTGLLYPRHTAGACSVQLRLMRYVSGRWVLSRTVWVRNVDYGTRTRYSTRVSLPYAGSWRIVAYHADAGHVANTSGPRAVRAR